MIQGDFKTDNDISPIQGDDLVLTIDSKIQSFSEKVFKDFKGSSFGYESGKWRNNINDKQS